MKRIHASCVALVLVLAGCGGGNEQTNTALVNTRETGAADTTGSPSQRQHAQDRPPDERIQEAVDRFLAGDAYKELMSYRLVVETQQTIAAEGGDVVTQARYEEARAGDVRQVVIEGDPNQPANETYLRGDTVYQVAGDQCQATPLDRESFELAMDMRRSMMSMGVALALGGQAELVTRATTVNGVVSDHFRMVQDGVSEVELESEVWLSQVGHDLVKLASRTTIANTLEMRVNVDLTEVNSPVSIVIPAMCER